jgi:hypothetical protein
MEAAGRVKRDGPFPAEEGGEPSSSDAPAVSHPSIII